MFTGNKLAFIYICSLCSRFLGNESKVCKLRWIIFGHAELKNQQNIFKQTNWFELNLMCQTLGGKSTAL